MKRAKASAALSAALFDLKGIILTCKQYFIIHEAFNYCSTNERQFRVDMFIGMSADRYSDIRFMDVDALEQFWDFRFACYVDVAEMVMCVADIQVDVSDCSFLRR